MSKTVLIALLAAVGAVLIVLVTSSRGVGRHGKIESIEVRAIMGWSSSRILKIDRNGRGSISSHEHWGGYEHFDLNSGSLFLETKKGLTFWEEVSKENYDETEDTYPPKAAMGQKCVKFDKGNDEGWIAYITWHYKDGSERFASAHYGCISPRVQELTENIGLLFRLANNSVVSDQRPQ